MKTGIFRDELPGEKKSIINLLMTGYLVVISILGYMAFYLTIQMGQIDRILQQMDRDALTTEQFNVLRDRLSITTKRLSVEVKWLAALGSLFALIGGAYTYNMIIRPLRKLVTCVEEGSDDLPEISSNNEIKQLMTAFYAARSKTSPANPQNFSNN